jgi:hypothetical protein
VALGRLTNEAFDADHATRFFLRESAKLGAPDFPGLVLRGKQLKYSLK